MELKSFFSKKTRRGRAVRTTLQSFVGLMTFVLGLLTLPGFQETLNSAGFAVQAGAIAGWIGVISYLQNGLESLITYLWEE